MSIYEVELEDGSVYEVETEDAPAAVDTSPSWGEAIYQGGKSALSGAAGLLDLPQTVFSALGRQVGLDLPQSEIRRDVERASQAVAPKLGMTADSRGDVIVGDAADVVKGGMEASVFPAGKIWANALSGVGAVLAEKAFPESKWAPLAGSLVAPLAAEGAIMTARGLSPRVNAGKALLSEAGATGRGNMIRAAAAGKTQGAVGPLTYAELAQTPSAAAFQQTIRKIPGPAGEALEEAFTKRQAARVAGLQGQAPDALTGVTPAERGAIVQPRAADVAEAAVDAANDAYRGLGNPGGIDTLRAKFSVGTTAHNLFANNPIPMNSEAAAVLEAFRSGPRARSLAELDGLRQAAGRVIGKLSIADRRAPEISLMESIRAGIDDSIERAIQEGAIEPQVARALESARFGRRFAGQKYESAPIRAMTKKGEYGEGFKMAAEDVIPRLMAGDKEADALLAAFGGDRAIMQEARGGLLDQMAGQGTRNYQSWPRFFKNKKGVFDKVFYKDAPKVKAIIDDIASEVGVQEMASRASKGQSATAQYLTAAKRFLEQGPGQLIRIAGNLKVGAGGAITAGWFSGNPLIGGLALAGSLTAKQLSKRMEIWIAKGMADPEVLNLLASRATANNVSKIAELFLGSLGGGALASRPSEGIAEPPDQIRGNGRGDEQQDEQPEDSAKNGKQNGVRHVSKSTPSALAAPTVFSARRISNDSSPLAALFGGQANDTPASYLASALFGAKKNGDAMRGTASDYVDIVEKLLPRVIAAESAGRADAVSRKGARGLMQIMPATWEEWAPKVGVPLDAIDDPEANTTVGRAYLNWLLQQTGGRPELALAAYNHGIGNVKRLINQFGNTFESIYPQLPAETQHYVMRILGDRAVL